MKPEIPILVTLFLSVAFAIKAVVDARARAKLVSANVPEDMLRAILSSDERLRRLSSLRWGITLVCLGIGFAVIQATGTTQVTPGAIGVLLAAAGLGNIVSYGIARKFEPAKPLP